MKAIRPPRGFSDTPWARPIAGMLDALRRMSELGIRAEFGTGGSSWNPPSGHAGMDGAKALASAEPGIRLLAREFPDKRTKASCGPNGIVLYIHPGMRYSKTIEVELPRYDGLHRTESEGEWSLDTDALGIGVAGWLAALRAMAGRAGKARAVWEGEPGHLWAAGGFLESFSPGRTPIEAARNALIARHAAVGLSGYARSMPVSMRAAGEGGGWVEARLGEEDRARLSLAPRGV